MSASGTRLFGLSHGRIASLAALANILAVVGGLIGGGWVFWEYTQRMEAGRAAETLKLVDSWIDREPQVAYRRLDDAMSKAINALGPSDLALLQASDQARQEGLRKMGARVSRDPEVLADLVAVESFFNRLAICVDADLCSVKVTRAYFGSTMEKLLERYGEAMGNRRSDGWSTFGLSTIALVERMK
jgi:hypothetical protein